MVEIQRKKDSNHVQVPVSISECCVYKNDVSMCALAVHLKESPEIGISKTSMKQKLEHLLLPNQHRLSGSNKELEERCIFFHWHRPTPSIKNKQKKSKDEKRETCV